MYCAEYLAMSRAEHRSWNRWLREADLDEDTWPPPSPWKKSLKRSWDRLFEAPIDPWRGHADSPTGDEAVVEELRFADVRDVRSFVGTNTMVAEWLEKIQAGQPEAGR